MLLEAQQDALILQKPTKTLFFDVFAVEDLTFIVSDDVEKLEQIHRLCS